MHPPLPNSDHHDELAATAVPIGQGWEPRSYRVADLKVIITNNTLMPWGSSGEKKRTFRTNADEVPYTAKS